MSTASPVPRPYYQPSYTIASPALRPYYQPPCTTASPALPPALHYWQALGKALRLQLQITAMRASGHADSPGVLEILSGASHALLGPGGLVRSRITLTLTPTPTLSLSLALTL